MKQQLEQHEWTPQEAYDSLKVDIGIWRSLITRKICAGPCKGITWEIVKSMQELSEDLCTILHKLNENQHWQD
jgi:hypothetical protein